MALKKTVRKTVTTATAKTKTRSVKPAAQKNPTKPSKSASSTVTAHKDSPLSGEQLVIENLATLSSLVRAISETLDVLVQKVENMAYHLIATEETLAEVVATTGVDLVQVNKRIRTKIANGTNKAGDPSRAIDIAASIVSPLPKTGR